MSFELEKIASDVERIAESMGEGGGGSGGILIATIDGSTMTLDKTWKQVFEASFTMILMQMPGSTDKGFGYVYRVNHDSNGYDVIVFAGSVENLMVLTTDSEDGYPVLQSN